MLGDIFIVTLTICDESNIFIMFAPASDSFVLTNVLPSKLVLQRALYFYCPLYCVKEQ